MPAKQITDFTLEELISQLQALTQQSTNTEVQVTEVTDLVAGSAPNTEPTTQSAPVAVTPTYLMNTIQSSNTGRPWAKKSSFYNQVMRDGYIFNPFLHRRFLPIQFLKMMRHNDNVIAQIKANYDYQYSIHWLRDEVKKLALLENTDPIAFNERKLFLTQTKIKSIIANYVANVEKEIKTLTGREYIDKDNQIFKNLNGRGQVLVGKVTKKISKDERSVETVIVPSKSGLSLIYDVNRLLDINSNTSYSEINALFKSFKWIDLPKNTNKGREWVGCFYAQGAYYTIKHLIVMQGLSFKNTRGQEATNLLFTHATNEDYVLYAMLKECIADNNYIIPDVR